MNQIGLVIVRTVFAQHFLNTELVLFELRQLPVRTV